MEWWVAFYYKGTELMRYDLLNEFKEERQATKENLAYENSCTVDDIEVRLVQE